MEQRLRILIVEDDADDLRLVELALRRAPFEVELRCASTEHELRTALTESWDVVLSDYSLPELDAPRVLSAVRDTGRDIPVIVVSGTIGEERAVALLREGANNFISKDRLARLVPAIEREVRDAALRVEQRMLREQMMISDRMASLGMISTGVTHEINNPLGVLMGTLSIIEEATRTAPPEEKETKAIQDIARYLPDATEAARRIRQIVRDVRTFSRFDGSDPPVPVNPRTVIASSLRLAGMQLRSRVQVEEQLADTPPVLAHEGKLGQVLVNLFVNAAQAMSEGSYETNKLLVRTSLGKGNSVEIAVTDTGCGISPESLTRIFEPFYTTKPAGLGTGLGLAICRRIIDELGGELDVESVVGRGSTFRVSLPVFENDEGRRRVVRADPSLPRSEPREDARDSATRGMMSEAVRGKRAQQG